METNSNAGETAKEQPEQNTATPKAKSTPKTYTSGELWMYGSIGALLTGVLGFFIGQAQGEKKAKQHYEHAVNEWRKKTESKKDLDENPTFSLE